MIRIAAVGDVHVGTDSGGRLGRCYDHVGERADVLLLAGDLTRRGEVAEARVLARELSGVPVPVVAVLGNHDYHSDCVDEVVKVLNDGGVTVLDGDNTVVDVGGQRLGIAGTKGFGGGFPGACGSDFGEPEMKAFMHHSRAVAAELEDALRDLDTDKRIALTHFAPVEDTLRGERLEIYPFLGSYFLAEAIDAAGADLAIHGHAHGGCEKGVTPGGVHVRNVAEPVIRQSYAVYCLDN